MDRVRCIQILMKAKGLKNYLEIGVFNGHVFFRVKSRFKIAVDPGFFFDMARKFGKTLLNPYNLFNRYYPKTSDDFFAQDAPGLFAGRSIDIALIDGMHEYAFALRDAENTLHYLSDRGVILMHDCNPQTVEATCSFADWKSRNYAGTWNGDVWKTILYLRSLRPDLDVFVLDTDQGLGIITKKENANPLPYTRGQIEGFTFEDLNSNRDQWLNLRPAKFFYEYFGLE